ncbi:hypothetical protein X777_15659 [Ooceraea biroi]|uniref:Apolipophorin-III n=1 Tax=Ooceraea biroi TaxID=2015173 RepID=A0A026VV10_OOCBI|nr:hypothetical protein X777_15659 [Ooceraea biroi]
MKCLLAIILGVAFIAVESKVVPASGDDPQETQPLQISDHIREAQNLINNLGAQIQQQLNLPNQEELVNTFKEQSSNLATNVQAYIRNITDRQVKNKTPELETLWTNVKTRLSEMVDKLNVNPETTEQVNQLRSTFQEGIQTLVTESENAAKSISENSAIVQEGIAKMTKQAIDIAVEASQNLKNQLTQHATTPQA